MERQDVVAFLDDLFPPALAEPWDRSGLQVGPLRSPCGRVLVALDFSLALAADLREVDLVVTHHPLLFRPLERVLPETPLGEKVAALLGAGTALYAVHTPYDVAHGGLGEVLASLLGLTAVGPLAPRGRLLKLVVFVPQGNEDRVAEALFGAGAGGIGNYAHCSFRSPGTGTFLPGAGARPFLGEVGREERAAEVRLETIVPGERVPGVLRAMRDAHPYEEVAYDLYPLELAPSRHGLGRVGELPEPRRAEDVVSAFGEALGEAEPQAVYGDLNRAVRRVALCGGSGGSLVGEALAAGAELYLTGELGYHEGLGASEAGAIAVAFGHRATERPFVGHIAGLLRKRFPTLEMEER